MSRVMSTVVLARKYRPRRFAEMVGQEHVVQALGNALASGRLHHAYLFTGTRGIGKTTVSRILAKSLNCLGPDGTGGVTAEPCGACSACTAIDADRFVDYIELDAASNRGIEDARDLIERAAYRPSVGRFKVFMIDEAHQLTKDAFNALLKTLEEPPEHLKFVLATTDPDKLLPTVLSRCLQFNLRPMAPATVRDHLARVLAQEAVPFDEGGLRLLARAARGSMRDALSLADQAIAFGAGRVEEAAVRAMLGSVERSRALDLLRLLAARDAAGLLAALDELRRRGASATGALEEIALLAQQAALEQAVPGVLDPADPDTAEAHAAAALLPADELQLLYAIALHGRSELSLLADEHGALAMVLLRFLAFPSEAAGERVPVPPRAAPLRAPAPPSARAPVRPLAPVASTTASAVPSAQLPASTPASTPAAATATARPSGAVHPSGAAHPAPDRPAVAPTAPAARLAEPAEAADSAHSAAAPDPALGDRWCTLVAGLIQSGAVQALVRELAWSAALLAVEEGDGSAPPTWRLAVEREALRAPALRDRLAAALADALGAPVQLELVGAAADDSPARRDAAARARRQAEAEETIRGDPVVLELLAAYPGARIVPGSIKPA
jgi:DNA polymerase-3 subunit gamma/tau